MATAEVARLIPLEANVEDGEGAKSAPQSPPGLGRLKWTLLLATALLGTTGVAWLGARRLAQGGLQRATVSDTVTEVTSKPYSALHIYHGHEVQSSSHVWYALKTDKPIGSYATVAASHSAKFGGAWLITYKEGGKEYLCKASHYDTYWKPVVDGLCAKHSIDHTASAKDVCDRKFRALHVFHGHEAKSSSGIWYALRPNPPLGQYGTSGAAHASTFGGAWMLTKKDGGKEYLCKASHYDHYWKPVMDQLCAKHGIITTPAAKTACATA
mmetsp:Transcript_182/g.333  ORF Transcript_182/g.333 Transcript_182/m.333 type:complete len:269 (-) Transcript_182:342-1148(-)